MRRVAGEEQRRLTGRVAAADDRDRVAAAELGLHQRGGVVHARALELLEPRDRQPAVLHAGRDQDRARPQLLAVVQPDRVVVGTLLERRRAGRDRELGAELLGLQDGAVGQLGAGDAGREAEIVLDARRRPGLAAGGERVQRERVESLRRAVHRRREAGGAGADDDQVADLVLRARERQPEELRELDVARVAQHLAPAPDDHRGLLGGDAELAQQRLGVRVLLEVDPVVWQAVARGELADPARVGRVARADDAKARPQPDEHGPAQEERAQDQVAEVRVVGDELAQPFGRHGEDLAVLHDHRGQERSLAGEQIQLAEEAALSVHADRALATAVMALDDRDLARQDHEEVVAGVTLAEEHVAALDATALADRLERRELAVVEPRERAGAVLGLDECVAVESRAHGSSGGLGAAQRPRTSR